MHIFFPNKYFSHVSMLATTVKTCSLSLKALRPWTILTSNHNELDLSKTLFSGQAFRWKMMLILDEDERNECDGALNCIYSCVLSLNCSSGIGLPSTSSSTSSSTGTRPVFVALRKSKFGVQFSTLQECALTDQELKIMLESYFQLHVSLSDLFKEWMSDANFKEKAPFFIGQRVLQQPQIENIFSFICSSNNNIKRISGMVDNLCRRYGDYICTFLDQDFYSFPSIKQLTRADPSDLEQDLRNLGFGYRAKYIVESAKYLDSLENLDDYLAKLVEMPYQECKTELLKLSGVGPKVADCIALFSCGKTDVVPVDTHVLQIAARDYNVTVKTLNAKTYLEIGDAFRLAFGKYAGWAHSVLFAADLKSAQSTPASKKVKKLITPVSKKQKLA